MKKILITGASGNVGKTLHRGLQSKNYFIRLADLKEISDFTHESAEFLFLDILDFESLKHAMKGVDCVIHLAAIAQDDAWDQLEAINIRGTYNLFEAARIQKVPRIIFASTNQAVGFYRTNQTITSDVYPKPASLYGVTKVFGEALARLYSDKYGITVACLRIGSLEERPSEIRHLSTWISYRDMTHLVVRCIEAQYHFIVLYGVSANTRSFWQNPEAERIGYQPQDNAEIYANDPALKEVRDEVGKQFQGGQFCSAGFHGNPANID